ncbi:MAG: hypothetical protein ACK5Z5_00060 [Neisseriaceae bacterium]|jgi:hemoglobin
MLGTKKYTGNTMLKHIELSKKAFLTPKHFERWLEIFKQEARSILSEEAAQLITKRAASIANAIKQRLSQANIR